MISALVCGHDSLSGDLFAQRPLWPFQDLSPSPGAMTVNIGVRPAQSNRTEAWICFVTVLGNGIRCRLWLSKTANHSGIFFCMQTCTLCSLCDDVRLSVCWSAAQLSGCRFFCSGSQSQLVLLLSEAMFSDHLIFRLFSAFCTKGCCFPTPAVSVSR
jgi:hypothetical protein